jgi:hypothetical protein
MYLGGAIYFFLRGINTPHRSGCHVSKNLALMESIVAEF